MLKKNILKKTPYIKILLIVIPAEHCQYSQYNQFRKLQLNVIIVQFFLVKLNQKLVEFGKLIEEILTGIFLKAVVQNLNYFYILIYNAVYKYLSLKRVNLFVVFSQLRKY